MTLFEVTWSGQAREELADLWTRADATARRAILAAVQAIGGRLQDQPGNQGETRGDGVRADTADPLGLLFKIDETRWIVTVLHVWNLRRQP